YCVLSRGQLYAHRPGTTTAYLRCDCFGRLLQCGGPTAVSWTRFYSRGRETGYARGGVEPPALGISFSRRPRDCGPVNRDGQAELYSGWRDAGRLCFSHGKRSATTLAHICS